MKMVLTVAFLIGMPATVGLAQSLAKQACNLEVDVTDTDPEGTNVRSASSGAIVAALKTSSSDGFIVVHLTGQLGDGYEIDRAELIDSTLLSQKKCCFTGPDICTRAWQASVECRMAG